MKSKFFAILFSLVLLLMSFSAAAAAKPTVEQLERAGWICFDPDGPAPEFGLHCVRPKLNPLTGSPVSVPIMVFAPDTNEFIGTEILLRADVYGDQPCPQEGASLYTNIGVLPGGGEYWACHHKAE